MKPIIIACAASLFLASPLGAQQGQSIPEQTVPPPQPPPPSSQPPADLPPFVPPPPARLYDNYRPAAHHHRAGANPNSIRHHRVSRHHHATARRHAANRAVHVSKRTIRRCHSMTYKQLMRDGSCRVLMRQELNAPERRHHGASHHRHSGRHHRSGHKHRR